MKPSFFGYFIFLFLLLLPQKSISGFYLEPYLGVGALIRESGPVNLKNVGPNEKVERTSWPVIGDFYMRATLGGKVGWSELGLAFGLDLSGSYYNNMVIFGGIREKFWTVLPGAFLSYQFPVFFRLYGALIPYGFVLSAMEDKDCLSSHILHLCSPLPQDIKKEKPVIRSLKLGVGYTGLPFFNLNLEYQPFYLIATGNTKRKGFWTHGITAYVSYVF